MRRSDLRRLKAEIIETYELGRVRIDDVADKPHGIKDNWTPKFPVGEEKAYRDAYFK